jgi:RNA polymerase sigma factor (sigma-70 family)
MNSRSPFVAVPRLLACPGASPLARCPANPAGFGAATATPSPVGADGVPDHVLLVGFAAGDAHTGPAFVRRFQGRVYGMAINMLGDQGLAEDVAQEAFVRAWKHAATYDPQRASVATWLLRITHNLAIDAVRRRRPVAIGPEMVAALTPPGPATAVEDATVTSELAPRARAALNRLPPGQAKAVWLAAFYGHSAQQVAVSEGIPLGTAKSRIGRGLRTLRAELTRPGAV